MTRDLVAVKLINKMLLLVALLVYLPAISRADSEQPRHAIAMYGEPKHQDGFKHFSYVNPNAPKGGKISYGFVGSFDSLNQFIIKGTAPRGISDAILGNLVIESLMVRGRDEAFSVYSHIAKTITVPADRSWVRFTLDPKARFSDDQPITTADIKLTFDLLKTMGRPVYRRFYSKVASVEVEDKYNIRFNFIEGIDRESALLLALMPVLPAHLIEPETFDKTTLEFPVGSGPYVVVKVEPGKRLVLKRNPDYWGWDTPEIRGRYNFDEVRIEYFRSANSLFEAFKKGVVDLYRENDPSKWLNYYDFPAIKSGKAIQKAFTTEIPKGMRGFFLNTRRPPLDNIKVREALTMLLDFQWINDNLFSGQYARSTDYFTGSKLSAYGKPADDIEKQVLAKYPGLVREDVLNGSYRVITSSDKWRNNLRDALKLLKSAGYSNKNGKLINDATGKQLSLEILVAEVFEGTEKTALAFRKNLEQVGIDLQIRRVDSAQFWQRLKTFDFDAIDFLLTASLSPGGEQLFRWSSKAAKNPGTFNFAGVESKAIDELIETFLAAKTRGEFESLVRAYDRVLMSGFYVVPLFYSQEQWAGIWSYIKQPDKTSIYGMRPATWWYSRSALKQ